MSKFFTSKKKSQSDMLGVVIIVAFLIFVIIFVIVLSVNQQKNTISAEYSMNALTANFLTAAFRTTACDDYSLNELVVDCSKAVPSIKCSTLCKGDSCGCAKAVIRYLFNQTLDSWRENYYFNITGLKTDLYNSRGDCQNQTIGSSTSTLPIPIIESGKSIYATLTICK
jgi:hypothetical protein